MKTNAGVPTAATGRPIVVDGEEQLRLYDALPERWRNLVDSLPIKQDMRSITQYLERLGDERGHSLIVENFRLKFPGWEPEFYRAGSAASARAIRRGIAHEATQRQRKHRPLPPRMPL